MKKYMTMTFAMALSLAMSGVGFSQPGSVGTQDSVGVQGSSGTLIQGGTGVIEQPGVVSSTGVVGTQGTLDTQSTVGTPGAATPVGTNPNFGQSGILTTGTLTEERVRQIVREELARAGLTSGFGAGGLGTGTTTLKGSGAGMPPATTGAQGSPGSAPRMP